AHPPGAGVAAHVGERRLGHPEQRNLTFGGQPGDFLDMQFHPEVLLEPLGQPLQRGGQGLILEFLRGERGDDLPHFPARACGETFHLLERFSDRKSTRLNSSHVSISYAVFCWKKKRTNKTIIYDS